uniref:RANBP10 n=1 Tax=Podarcis muralis TaxID=64176 RepID=A0A670K2D3_PODMU
MATAASAGPMPAGSGGGSSAPAPFPHGGDPALNEQEKELKRRLKRLYLAVDEQETPLPRSWSPKDKFSYIGLSQNNLRVHYKGRGTEGGRGRGHRHPQVPSASSSERQAEKLPGKL